MTRKRGRLRIYLDVGRDLLGPIRGSLPRITTGRDVSVTLSFVRLHQAGGYMTEALEVVRRTLPPSYEVCLPEEMDQRDARADIFWRDDTPLSAKECELVRAFIKRPRCRLLRAPGFLVRSRMERLHPPGLATLSMEELWQLHAAIQSVSGSRSPQGRRSRRK